jgi:membrane-associated PAP2 superfamily phosphatase
MLPKRLLGLAFAALAIAWLGNGTDIDMRLAQLVYDHGSASFPLRHAWLAETFSHGVMRTVLSLIGACFVIAAAIDAWRPRPYWEHGVRMRLRVVALSAVLVPLATSLLKRVSSSHCPWDLQQFGGTELYVRLFDSAMAGAPAGHCMPAGHVSSALWLISLTVFWLPHRPRKAAAVFVLALGLGAVLGWVQQLRGAHFLTHTLWSIWIACAIVTLLHAALLEPSVLARAKSILRIKPRQEIGERAL